MCNLGEVLDLSAEGMRVRCRQPPSTPVPIVLLDYTRPGELVADLMWSRPIGNLQFEIGLKFRELDPKMLARLRTIASTHRYRRAG